MRRARAYSGTCLQVVFIYRHHFEAIHSFTAENRKNY